MIARALASAMLIAAGIVDIATAQSLPTGGTVTAGTATITQPSANRLVVNQTSSTAITNWQSFSIGVGNSVAVMQPSTSAAMLARVTGSTASTIAGSLSATGRLMLVNPNGIAITSTGTVNAGAGFVATTLGISDSDFLAGRISLTGTGTSAAVANAGTITVGPGGYAALIGGTVSNSGTIAVPMGKVGLGSGEIVTLDFSGDGFLQVGVPTQAPGKDALVSNTGKITANGGTVEIRAAAARDAARQAINMSGVIAARSVHGTDGDITLDGGDGTVVASGKLTVASRKTKGGNITVTGRDIRLTGARLDASGKTGGGTVRIGGDRQGIGTLRHAATTTVDAATVIKADATSTGNGGTVVIWSDILTRFAGTISATGGSLSGNGGEVEVSGKANLAYTGFTDLKAANGRYGNLLLDPYNVTISSGTDTGGFTASADDSVINATTLATALSSANVSVSTGTSGTQAGTITISAPLAWSAPTTLILIADSDITINAAINATGSGLIVSSGGTITDTAALNIGAFVLASGSWVQNSATLPAFSALDFRITPGTSFLRVTGGDGSGATPYQVADVYGLQGMGSSTTFLSQQWLLANDIDASVTTTWNNGAGFAPLGSSTDFSGTLDGHNHTISGLFILSSNASVGLFDTINAGTVQNLGIANATVTGAGTLVGILAGGNSGTISNVHTSGTVTGTASGVYAAVGGLFGLNIGTISNAYTSAQVGESHDAYVGGLVGINFGGISTSYASGAVTGGQSAYAGGLAGSNAGSIDNSYATGSVTGDQSAYVGGLVGDDSFGSISYSYASGAISGDTGSHIGGVVGVHAGSLSNIVWNTETTGQTAACSDSACTAAGLTTAQMSDPFTFIDAGWDFASTWAMLKTGGSPVLRGLTTNPVYTDYIRLSGNTSATYGDGITDTSGIAVSGVGAGNVTVSWGSAVSVTTNAGTYAYSGSNVLALSYSTGPAGDYYVNYGAGALTINVRALTVTADPLSRIYGDANPALTYTVGGLGLVNGDTLTGSLATSATGTSNVGSYAIGQGSLAASANYTVTYTGANLAVTQRALTVTADAQSRIYGDANPALTYTVGGLGLVNGDTLTGSLATSATGTSNVGSYAITQGSLAASSNYVLNYVGANLVVTQRTNPLPTSSFILVPNTPVAPPAPTAVADAGGSNAGSIFGFTSPGYDMPIACVPSRICPTP